MLSKLLPVKKELVFERTYAAPRARVWEAWTDAELLKKWWGPEKTSVPECVVDLHVGGRFFVVMEATAEMGKYAGTRWPMDATFTAIEPEHSLAYDARSWQEGSESKTSIRHDNVLSLTDNASGGTDLRLVVRLTEIGPGARLAAFGMKWGYNAQFDKLTNLLTGGQ